MLDNLSQNGFLIGTLIAVATTAGMMWSHVKAFFSSLSSLFIVTLHTKHYKLAHAVNLYCYHQLKRKNFGNNTYGAGNFFIRKKGKTNLIAYEKIDKPLFFWKGWFPVLVTTTETKSTNGGPDGDNTNFLTIKFFRGTFHADSFIETCVNYFNEQTHLHSEGGNRYKVTDVIGRDTDNDNQYSSRRIQDDIDECYRPIGYKLNEIGLQNDQKPFSKLAYPKKVKDLIKDAEFWHSSREWYRERGIRYKLGTHATGRPGTGKTSLARGIAQKLDIPVYRFDLASLSNQEFQKGWDLVRANTPCMPIFEDIDAVFNGRENIYAEKNPHALSFDMLLNSIDGIEECEGIYIWISSNDIEKVDPALGGNYGGHNLGLRPGRIDRVIHLLEIDKENALELCERILPEYKECWEEIVTQGMDSNETPAQFEHRCAIVAIEKHFKKNEGINAN